MSSTVKKDINSSLKFVYSENNSISVIFHENDLLMGVVGEFNQNLKELEKITNSSIYSRGNSILIKSTSEKNEILNARDQEIIFNVNDLNSGVYISHINASNANSNQKKIIKFGIIK